MLEALVNRFLYYPEPDWINTPARLGLNAEEIRLSPEPGIELHAWFFPRVEPIARLLFCHGNAGNASHRLENVYLLVQAGFEVLLFDYRGYGHSTGKPSEAGLYRDAETAWFYLTQKQGSTGMPHIIFGRSLGGAVAVEVAIRVQTQPKHTGLILESTFPSISTLVRLMFPISLPTLPVTYDSQTKIGKLRMPLLAIHGEQDELIPYSEGLTLYEAAPEPKEWYSIAAAGHNDTYIVGGEAYFWRLAAFARSLRDAASAP